MATGCAHQPDPLLLPEWPPHASTCSQATPSHPTCRDTPSSLYSGLSSPGSCRPSSSFLPVSCPPTPFPASCISATSEPWTLHACAPSCYIPSWRCPLLAVSPTGSPPCGQLPLLTASPRRPSLQAAVGGGWLFRSVSPRGDCQALLRTLAHPQVTARHPPWVSGLSGIKGL